MPNERQGVQGGESQVPHSKEQQKRAYILTELRKEGESSPRFSSNTEKEGLTLVKT